MVRPLTLQHWAEMLRAHAGSAIWSASEQGIGPLVQLLLTAVLLRTLGTADFAVWAIGISLIGLSQLVSAGAGFSALKHVSADLGAGRPELARQAIRSALALALGGGLLATLAAVLLAPAVAAHGFRQLGPLTSVSSMLMLCGAGALFNEIDSVFACAMRGAQRFDRAAHVECSGRVLMAVMILWLALRGAGVVHLFGVWVGLLALKAGIKGLAVMRMFASHELLLPSFSREPMRRILKFGQWQWLQATGTTLFTSVDQLVVGSVLGAAALSRYSVCLQLAQYVHLVPSVLLQILFPRISARGPMIGAVRGNQILDTATVLAAGAAGVLGCGLALAAGPVLSRWAGPEFADSNTGLLRLLIAAHVVLALNIGGYYVLLATGRAARLAAVVLGAGALQLMGVILAAPFGLLAVAGSRFIYSASTAALWKIARYRDGS